MHPDEHPVPESLVRTLLAGSFPEWAALKLSRVTSAGTDNAMFRLGEDLVVRLPKIGWAVKGIHHEYEWIPKLAPHLPFATPEPLALGHPAAGYPWPWAVYRWLEGTNPIANQVTHGVAEDIAELITALRAIRIPNPPTSTRGKPLATRDAMTREAIADLGGKVARKAVTEVWEKALAVPGWEGEPVWVHADLTPGNVLVRDGKVSAVIDFSLSGVGDPAADLGVAWNLLPAPARETFREALGDDDATWERGRALALSIALVQLRYYWDSNPPLVANSRHVIGEILAGPA
ncbi:aminoglycoside phosphotransferase family protein [Actinosynnema sp. NPDC047251]|uniref:Phosphotransferase n=1 Tax=Saccharothrix espanaensis (strain ATCC 51144 / DSM 44229 / JCM 9112 / NBRC 15066 / NRRL 15764) TaxID=1179773 RepID=K0K9F4_SACES|nr:aminoglycoside phosphotransferase family protein [Saccharothrix espanaensis]CCH34147.1 Phosphotransferase [Saccharothrix espanaensis DSM 44229]